MGGLFFLGIIAIIAMISYITSKIHDAKDSVKQRDRLEWDLRYANEKIHKLEERKQEQSQDEIAFEIRNLQNELYAKDKTIEDLKQQIANTPSQVNRRAFEELRLQNASLKNELYEKNKIIERYASANDNSAFEQSIKNKETEIISLENHLNDLREEIDSAEKDAQTLRQFQHEARAFIHHINSSFHTNYGIDDFIGSIESGRLNTALQSDIELKNFNISCEIVSGSETYETKLWSCDCTDFIVHKRPCKHMLLLAYSFGYLYKSAYSEKYRKITADLSNEIDRLSKNKKITEKEITQAQAKLNKLKAQQKASEKALKESVSTIEQIFNEKCSAFPYFSFLLADVKTYHYERSAQLLESKKSPAPVEAMRIRQLREETKRYIAQKEEAEKRLAYICQLFPNINTVLEDDFVPSKWFRIQYSSDFYKE